MNAKILPKKFYSHSSSFPKKKLSIYFRQPLFFLLSPFSTSFALSFKHQTRNVNKNLFIKQTWNTFYYSRRLLMWSLLMLWFVYCYQIDQIYKDRKESFHNKKTDYFVRLHLLSFGYDPFKRRLTKLTSLKEEIFQNEYSVLKFLNVFSIRIWSFLTQYVLRTHV